MIRDVAAHRAARDRGKEALPERRLLLRVHLLHTGDRHRSLHPDLRGQPYLRLGGALPRAVREQSTDPSADRLHRAAASADAAAARSAVAEASGRRRRAPEFYTAE